MDNEQNETHDRRDFLKGATVGVIGTLAATSMTSPTSAMAQIPAMAHQSQAQDPQRPKALGRRAMVDQRFPVTYQTSIPQGVSILTQFFVALSERNSKGIADLLHFPFGSWEAVDAVVVKTAEEFLAHAPASLNMNDHPERFTDHDGFLKPGAYDVFEGLEVLNVDPKMCAMSMVYNRYAADGRRLTRCEGIYTVTNNDGRWAIQAMSTIFTPDRMVGMVYPDVVELAKRLRVDHDLSYTASDRALEPSGHGGASMGIDNGGSPWNLGPAGKAMDQFKVVGVKSRLTYRAPDTPSPIPAATAKSRAEELEDYADYRKLMGSTVGEQWGWVYGIIPETRVIHHTVNKAHRFSAAVRFTASGEEISTNTDLTVVTFRKGKWANAGSFAYTTPHDRANNVDVPAPLYVPPATPRRRAGNEE